MFTLKALLGRVYVQLLRRRRLRVRLMLTSTLALTLAHGCVLVNQNGAEMYCGQSSSWSVVLVVVVRRRGQSFFVVSLLCGQSFFILVFGWVGGGIGGISPFSGFVSPFSCFVSIDFSVLM